jgi:hypothetical protein
LVGADLNQPILAVMRAKPIAVMLGCSRSDSERLRERPSGAGPRLFRALDDGADGDLLARNFNSAQPNP